MGGCGVRLMATHIWRSVSPSARAQLGVAEVRVADTASVRSTIAVIVMALSEGARRGDRRPGLENEKTRNEFLDSIESPGHLR